MSTAVKARDSSEHPQNDQNERIPKRNVDVEYVTLFHKDRDCFYEVPVDKRKLKSLVDDWSKTQFERANRKFRHGTLVRTPLCTQGLPKGRDYSDWQDISLSLRQLPGYYASLSKIRLTGLIVITQMAGYSLAPGVFDPVILGLATVGTALTSSAANTLNQFLEVPYDSQMKRTSTRVLVRRKMSSLHALGFAGVAGSLGVTLLYVGVNPLTAGLGLFNLLVYVCLYTPLKRLSVLNTWVGSVCGAVPPVMGWAAATGSIDTGALLLGAIMYSWQFPHFNALSWRLRPDYSRAGYRMLAVTDPAMLRRVALRHSAALTLMCLAAPLCDLTSPWFILASAPVNARLCWLSWRFYRQSDAQSASRLFLYTLAHIPLLLLGMYVTKQTTLEALQHPLVTLGVASAAS